jgi:hypothetical protein
MQSMALTFIPLAAVNMLNVCKHPSYICRNFKFSGMWLSSFVNCYCVMTKGVLY